MQTPTDPECAGQPDNQNMVINDIVHGLIDIPPHIRVIMDTPQFQRLRSVTQLGLTQFVYPCAAYLRFEHSLGTFHLASRVLKNLKPDIDRVLEDKKGVISAEALVRCVEIAALCHDLGHGPYSHLWDQVIVPAVEPEGARVKHEELSVQILMDVLDATGNAALDPDADAGTQRALIGAVITGEWQQGGDYRSRFEDMPFVLEMVANKQSGLDLDKLDYLCRDPIYLGWSSRDRVRDVDRMLHFYRLCRLAGDDGKWHLAMRDQEVLHVYDMFYARHMLHRYAYQHKTVKALEGMVLHALAPLLDKDKDSRRALIERVMGRSGDEDISVCSKEFVSRACDHHVWDFMGQHTPDAVAAICKRELYKLLCKFRVTGGTDKETLRKHAGALQGILNGDAGTGKGAFYVTTATFQLRSEQLQDPIQRVPFYKKATPRLCFMFADADSLPEAVRGVSDECVLMLFATEQRGGLARTRLDPAKEILTGRVSSSDPPRGWQSELLAYIKGPMGGCRLRELHY